MEDDDEIPKPNMTPMIDVVFQLLIFFLVNMKFKTLDMKIDAFLPKDRGLAKTITQIEEKPKLVAVLKRQKGQKTTRVKVANVTIGDTAKANRDSTWQKLTAMARKVLDNHVKVGGSPEDVTGEVDAAEHVPTGDVVRAVDAFIAAGIDNVTFVGTPPPGSTLDQLKGQ